LKLSPVTTVPPPTLDEVDRVAAWFGPDAAGRGLAYYREGRVSLLKCDDERALGRVRGSRTQPYATSVELARGDDDTAPVDSLCACPLRVGCKHAAAMALAWLVEHRRAGDGGARERGTPAASAAAPATPTGSELRPFVPEPKGGAPSLPKPAYDAWQDWLAAGTRQAPRDDARPAAETVLYLIRAETGALLLSPVRCRVLRSGRWGAPKPIDLDDDTPLRRLRKLSPEDRALVLSLRAQTTSYDDRRRWLVLDEDEGPILERMLATGRARLGAPNGAVLRAGAPRAIVFAWREDEGGAQHLEARLATGEGLVLGRGWPWYLDEARGELGRTDAGALAAHRGELQQMPAILPESLESAREALRRRGLAERLPAPRARRVEVRRSRAPRALLTLRRSPYDYDRERLRQGVLASLAFRYDGTTIAADDHRPSLRTVQGDAVTVVLREPEFERTTVRALGREGFRPQGWYGSGESRMAREWQRPQALNGIAAIDAWVRGLVERLRPFAIDVVTADDFPTFLGVELDTPSLELEADGEDWFSARLGIVVDGIPLDLLPVLLRALDDPEAVTARGLRLTLPDGRLALLPRSRLDAILGVLADLERREGGLGMPRARLPSFVAPPDMRFVPGPKAQAFLAEIEGFRGLEVMAPPPGFGAQLRPYQALGLAWLDFLRRYRFGGVLADDMGLGKTVQVLAWLAHERAAGRLAVPALVVCPTSVAPNWRAEAQRFVPELRVMLLTRGDRSTALAELQGQDLVITSYALLLRDLQALANQAWSVAVFDEAQWLKNSASQSHQAARSLRAATRLCLTGTPVENHLGELKAQFDLVLPGLLGDDRQFAQRFRQPIERGRDADAAERLRRRVRPFLLRRTKAEVAQELPPRTLIAQPVELGDAQRDLYEALRAQMEKRVRDALAKRGLAASHITVLDALLKLRQACCDPRLVDLPSARKVKVSAKLETLFELLPTLIEDGRSVLLFSQFTSMLDLIETELRARGLAYVRLDGRTRDRAAPVERFQSGDVPLFLVSLKAGGVGLNLTRADTVILYDPWWNPAAEAQAIDRAHRIGQDKPVFVYELTCSGTVEERMQSLKARKRAVAEAVLAGGEAALSSLSADDLLALFAPGRELA
jgi:superfamily II DNA or RNA helicase